MIRLRLEKLEGQSMHPDSVRTRLYAGVIQTYSTLLQIADWHRYGTDATLLY